MPHYTFSLHHHHKARFGSSYKHLSSYLFDHLFRVLVHGFDEGADVLRLHVGVNAVAEVGDVAPCAETLQHLLHDV